MLTLLLRDDFVCNGVACMLVDLNAEGHIRAVGESVTIKSLPVDINGRPYGDGYPAEPTFRLSRDQAQALTDRLWSLGYRPAESGTSVGALAQAESHIASLREVTRALLPK